MGAIFMKFGRAPTTLRSLIIGRPPKPVASTAEDLRVSRASPAPRVSDGECLIV